MTRPSFVSSSLGPDLKVPLPDDTLHENEWYRQDFGDYEISEFPIYAKRPIRLICVGAGATGLQLAYKAERLLENVTLQIYEKNNDIGGTWLENRYPGCTCDIPSHSYQFTWARNPHWSHYYSDSKEIWQYFKDVATRFDLERYVKLSHSVQSARWDETQGVWELSVLTPDGTIMADKCEILVNGTGVLNNWKYPKIPGLSSFRGKLMHSSSWDADYDLTGKTVAVVGGGSSAVQVIPSIQPGISAMTFENPIFVVRKANDTSVVKKLIPFLRSPVWITTGFGARYSGPGGSNFEYTQEQIQSFKDNPKLYDEYCRNLEGELNKRFTLNHLHSTDQKESRELIENLMKEQLNHDDRLVKHLIPSFALGCRRMTPGSGYLQSLTKENVEPVVSGAVRFTENGVVDEAGKEHTVDVIICATGFNTSYAPPYQCVGRHGQDLREKFGEFPKGYMSTMVDGFPNFFLFIGPNGPASHSSLLPVLEWHTRYLFQIINKLQQENIKALDPKPECVEDFSQHSHTMMKRLVWSSACRSWFKNGKVHGPVTAIWPGSRLHYFEALGTPRYEDFVITYLSKNRYQYLGNGYTQEEIGPGRNTVWYFDDAFCKV